MVTNYPNKNLRLKNSLWIIVCIVLVIFVAVECTNQKNQPTASKSIQFANVEFQIGIASTDQSRTKGLSDTKSLGVDRGLFFDFEEEGNYGIWMKDMNYSLDIIWLDKNLEVVHIEESISPDTYPVVFYSPDPARYVLEINAGLASKHEIMVGEKGSLG